MGISSELRDDGIRVVTMEHPPVNALPVQGWFDLAAALDEAGHDLDTHVVVLRAEGRGFNAGVDIKEMQNTTGFDALIGANRGCYAAFKAVYECAVPVIAAVNGFCLGGGVGLVGNADIVGGQRRRLLRRARGRPGCARCGHPHGPAGAAAPDAHPLLHRPHHHRRRAGRSTARCSRWSPATSSTRPR